MWCGVFTCSILASIMGILTSMYWANTWKMCSPVLHPQIGAGTNIEFLTDQGETHRMNIYYAKTSKLVSDFFVTWTVFSHQLCPAWLLAGPKWWLKTVRGTKNPKPVLKFLHNMYTCILIPESLALISQEFNFGARPYCEDILVRLCITA